MFNPNIFFLGLLLCPVIGLTLGFIVHRNKD